MTKRNAAALFAGLLFALGLGISGMTDANKVIGFLNLAGDWDPSLAFVMVGAIGVHIFAYRGNGARFGPFLGEHTALPAPKAVDKRLIAGAATFGVGWGIGGFCPGPAVVSCLSGMLAPAIFTAAMIAGMLLARSIASQTRN